MRASKLFAPEDPKPQADNQWQWDRPPGPSHRVTRAVLSMKIGVRLRPTERMVVVVVGGGGSANEKKNKRKTEEKKKFRCPEKFVLKIRLVKIVFSSPFLLPFSFLCRNDTHEVVVCHAEHTRCWARERNNRRTGKHAMCNV